MKKALTARDVVGDDRLDVAVSRDNLAAVKEAQGDWKEARTLRAKGGENGWREMVCSWGEVSLFPRYV